MKYKKPVLFPLLKAYRLSKEQDKKVKEAAQKQKISEAEIIRDLIDKNL